MPRRMSVRPGFTFVEVMFAVIIMGIGFILIAAIFPYAIRQTQSAVEDTTGAAIARMMMGTLQPLAGESLLPSTGGVVRSFRAAAYPDPYLRVRGSLVLSGDPRFAWVPMYRRADGESFAQVIVIGAQVRTRDAFQTWLDTRRYPNDASGDPPATLEPRELTATFAAGATEADPDTVRFSGASDMIDSGAFLVVADDPAAGRTNGLIYRVGNRIDASAFELQPGYDIGPAAPAPGTVKVLALGRGWRDPTNPGDYDGAVMDICAYTTFLRVN